MSMTRQHFEAIAETLLKVRPEMGRFSRGADYTAAQLQWSNTALELARTLGQFNAGFNRDRFLRACGVEGF